MTLLAPMAAAEHGVERAEREVARAEHFFGFHRHRDPAAPEGGGSSSPPPGTPTA